MYKFSAHLSKSHLVLVRKQLCDGTCSALVVMRGPVRRYADARVCPPPKDKRVSKALLWGAAGAALLSGAAIVYAKNSPDARNWLESNTPWANRVIAVVYQENQTYYEFGAEQAGRVSQVVRDFLFGKEGISPLEFQQRSEQDIEKDAEIAFAPKKYELPPRPLEPLYVEKKKITNPDVDEPSMLIRTEKCKPKKPVEVKITKDIVELEKNMHENTKSAVEQYKQCTKLCAAYNKALFAVIESPASSYDKKLFSGLKGSKLEREKQCAAAAESAARAKCAIDTLDRLIMDGEVKAPPEEIAMTKRYINKFRSDIMAEEQRAKEEDEKSVLADKFCARVQEARSRYKEELETLFPELDLTARKLVVNDPDLLLLYTLQQIQFLQNQLAELQTIKDQKINRAIECKDEKMIIEAKVDSELIRERLNKELEFQRKILKINADFEKKLRQELKKQHEVHMDALQDKIKRKEKEINSKFNRAVSEELEQERLETKKELAALAGKLKAMESTLKKRQKQEAEAQRAHSVWAAAEALLSATRRPQRCTPVDSEIKALEQAGKGDKLVRNVVKAIDPEIRSRGIETEKSLKDRFEILEKTTSKVALIGREGASLPMYFLSWLQAKFLFQKLAEIPTDELNNLPTDFSELDTFDIMQRARYYMDNGCMENALRYVNLLQGAPRAAACAWMRDARQHLEVKQAAEAVMAHAALSAMRK